MEKLNTLAAQRHLQTPVRTLFLFFTSGPVFFPSRELDSKVLPRSSRLALNTPFSDITSVLHHQCTRASTIHVPGRGGVYALAYQLAGDRRQCGVAESGHHVVLSISGYHRWCWLSRLPEKKRDERPWWRSALLASFSFHSRYRCQWSRKAILGIKGRSIYTVLKMEISLHRSFNTLKCVYFSFYWEETCAKSNEGRVCQIIDFWIHKNVPQLEIENNLCDFRQKHCNFWIALSLVFKFK